MSERGQGERERESGTHLLLRALSFRLNRDSTPSQHHSSFQAGVLRLTTTILGLPVLGSAFRLSHAMVALTGTALLSSSRASGTPAYAGGSASAMTAALAKRFRGERNAWISFTAFAFWLILLRVHAMVARLAALQGGPSAAAATAAAAAPAGPSRRAGSGVASPPVDRSSSAAAAAARAAAKEAALAGGAASAPPLPRAEKKGQ